MLTYLLYYYLTGLILLGAAHFHRWLITRKYGPIYPVLVQVILLPLTAWFWPFFLFLALKNREPLCDDFYGDSAAMVTINDQRRRANFLRNLPRCSAIVRMDVSTFPSNSDSVGVLYLESEAMWREISGRVEKHPHLANDDEGSAMTWLATRQADDSTPCAPPSGLGRLTITADQLVRQGHGRAECKVCDRFYSIQSLTYNDEFGRALSNHNQIQCPQGHLLLRNLRMRFIRTSSGAPSPRS